MRTSCIASRLSGLVALLLLMPAAHALDDNGAKAVIGKFIGAQKIDGADASADKHVIADLNGDGKPDIVLLWNVIGPTWGYSKMSIFLDQGKNYRTLTTDLPGQVEKLTVKGSTILIDTLTPGPNDPRCCPTVKTQQRFQWTGGKLVVLK
ncbi:MAG: hypothetical protein ACREQW_01710 [Candidatus Binatia bacterium]